MHDDGDILSKAFYDACNEQFAEMLTKANMTLNPFDLILLKIDMVIDILVDKEIISSEEIGRKWSIYLHDELLEAINQIEQPEENQSND